MKRIFDRPHLPFLLVAGFCFVIALVYRFFFADEYIDISAKHYFSLSNYYAWALLGGYVLLLSIIYSIAVRGKLNFKIWIVKLHFIFLLFFLIFFYLFSSFNSAWLQALISSVPFLVLMGIYGGVFLLDVFLFLAGLVILIVNVFSAKKQ